MRIWPLENETDTKSNFHHHKYECIWEAAMEMCIKCLTFIVASIKIFLYYMKWETCNTSTAKFYLDTVEHNKQCVINV